jgi:hypothetical protein
VQRLRKTLEDATIKLASVLTDVTATSGRAIVEALIAGESDPATLAALAHRSVEAPPEKLAEALRGRVTSRDAVACTGSADAICGCGIGLRGTPPRDRALFRGKPVAACHPARLAEVVIAFGE